MNNQKNKIILLVVGIILVISIGVISYFVFNIFGEKEDPIDTLINGENNQIDNVPESDSDEVISEDTRGYEFIEAIETTEDNQVVVSSPLKQENRFIFINKSNGEIKESKDYVTSEYIGKIPDTNVEEAYISEKKFKNYLVYKKDDIYSIFDIKNNKKIEVPSEVDQVEIDNYEDNAYFLFDKDSETSQIYKYNFSTGANELLSNRQNIKWIQVSDKNLFYQASLNIYRYVDQKEYQIAQGLESISIKLGGLFNKGILEVDGVSYIYDYTNNNVKLNQLAFYVDPKNVVWSDIEREFYTITENNIYRYNWVTQISTKTNISQLNLGTENQEQINLRDFDLDSMLIHNGYIYINNITDNKIYNILDMSNLE